MRRISMCCTIAAVTAMTAGLATSPTAAAQRDIQVTCSTSDLISKLKNAQTGDTFQLARNCTYSLTTPYQGGDDGLPPIKKRITIHGRDSTISRDPAFGNQFRIFDIAAGGDLHADDLTIQQGNASGDGGGILVQSGGSLELQDSSLIDNMANDGGGVAVQGKATIQNTFVGYNTADFAGGGLFCAGCTLQVTRGSDFYENSATGFGGGVDIESGSGTLLFDDTTLEENMAPTGAALETERATVEVDRGHVTHNTTTSKSGGGALYNGASPQTGSLTLDHTDVTENLSSGIGSGIFSETKLTLRSSTVSNNRANGTKSKAGGIYKASGNVTLDHSRVRENVSTLAPGGVYNDTSGTFSVIHSSITANKPTNCKGSPAPVPDCVN
ncbi:right-handed parallel beta-helix repeat-containing protein [Streptomyces sp. NPDC058964]|uniref:right-handed parallel beta-helix repeat-containing protein n=1 Tax=Streptomyces sp. NPDC058964 TaxID=3346681 RepID=UPI0036BB9E90